MSLQEPTGIIRLAQAMSNSPRSVVVQTDVDEAIKLMDLLHPQSRNLKVIRLKEIKPVRYSKLMINIERDDTRKIV